MRRVSLGTALSRSAAGTREVVQARDATHGFDEGPEGLDDLCADAGFRRPDEEGLSEGDEFPQEKELGVPRRADLARGGGVSRAAAGGEEEEGEGRRGEGGGEDGGGAGEEGEVRGGAGEVPC